MKNMKTPSNSQEIPLERILYILQVSQDLTKVSALTKVLMIPWQYRNTNMLRKQRNLVKNIDPIPLILCTLSTAYIYNIQINLTLTNYYHNMYNIITKNVNLHKDLKDHRSFIVS